MTDGQEESDSPQLLAPRRAWPSSTIKVLPSWNLAMALIYPLNNLIIVSARNELIESLNLPQILLSSLQHSHCPEHAIPSPPRTQAFL